MNQNKISDEEKIKLAKNAFSRFKFKIDVLMKRQNNVFARIMDRIYKRKLNEQRDKIDEVYKNKN